jgi:hypothetical protein
MLNRELRKEDRIYMEGKTSAAKWLSKKKLSMATKNKKNPRKKL